MDNIIFNAIKQELNADKKHAEELMSKVNFGKGVIVLKNIDEAMEALKNGKFIVGFSFCLKNNKLCAEFDNAYRLKGGNFFTYKFLANKSKLPFRMIPSQSVLMSEYIHCDSIVRDWIDELHHGFVLGDGVVDIEHIKRFESHIILEKFLRKN